MRDQAIAAAASSAHGRCRRLANNRTPKNANAAPVCPEGKEWYLFLNKRNSRPRHNPFHCCVASVLLGRARPLSRRTESTRTPDIVAANIIHSKILQTTL